MTDKKNDGLGNKKPAAIIDLKATVVETATPSKPSVETRAAFANNTSKPIEQPLTAVAGSSAAATASNKGADTKPAAAKPTEAKPEIKAAAAMAAAAAAARAAPAAPMAAVSTPAAPAPSRGGFASHLLSGVAGGVLALLGATQIGPMLGMGGVGGSDADRRIAELEQKLARAPAASAAQLPATAEKRLADLEQAAQGLASGQVKIATEMKAAEEKFAKGNVGLPSDAAEKIARLEDQLQQMAAAAGDPRSGRVPQVAQLTSKISEIETQITARNAQLKTELTQQLDQRLTKSGEVVETVRSTLSQRAQSTEQQLKSVLDNTAALRTDMDTVKLELDKRFAAAAKPADVQTAVASVATKVSTLETAMQGVAKSEAERNQTAGNILLSLELANLKRALDRGGKYSSELAAVKALAGPKLDLAVLEASQNTGVPSLAVLGKELAEVAHGMLDAEAEPANASVSDRLLSGVKSIVRVRKVDFQPGDNSTEALIARMEQGLKEGRLADVLEESKKLSPKALAPASKWVDRIKSRAAIDAALAALDASLKTSLAGGAAPKKVSN